MSRRRRVCKSLILLIVIDVWRDYHLGSRLDWSGHIVCLRAGLSLVCEVDGSVVDRGRRNVRNRHLMYAFFSVTGRPGSCSCLCISTSNCEWRVEGY